MSRLPSPPALNPRKIILPYNLSWLFFPNPAWYSYSCILFIMSLTLQQPQDSPHYHSETTLPSPSCSMEFFQLEPSLTPTCFSSHPLAHPCAWQQNPAGIVLQWSALLTWGRGLSMPPARDHVPGSCPCLWHAALYPGPGCHPCALPSPSHPLAC